MKKTDSILLARGYISEVIFSMMVLIFVLLLFREKTIADVLHIVAGKLAMLTAGLAATSFGMLGVYFNQTSSAFGKYLSWRGSSMAYLIVFGVAGIYQVICTAVLIFMAEFKSVTLSKICVFMIAMSVANVVSLISNMVAIIRLRDEFNRQMRMLDQRTDKSGNQL